MFHFESGMRAPDPIEYGSDAPDVGKLVGKMSADFGVPPSTVGRCGQLRRTF
jgi:hypothetical protein